MFLDEANPYTLGKATEYQFMCGPSFLVAPIYQETKMDKEGNDIRNGIYLPQGEWVDYFSGHIYIKVEESSTSLRLPTGNCLFS